MRTLWITEGPLVSNGNRISQSSVTLHLAQSLYHHANTPFSLYKISASFRKVKSFPYDASPVTPPHCMQDLILPYVLHFTRSHIHMHKDTHAQLLYIYTPTVLSLAVFQFSVSFIYILRFSSLQLTNVLTAQLPRTQNIGLARHINPLKTKHRLVYLKTQSVQRSKHFSFRL